MKSVSNSGINVACPECHAFFMAPEASLVQCECGFACVALRVAGLTDAQEKQHSCLRYSGIQLAMSERGALYALSPQSRYGDGSCAMSSCCWGAPFLLVNDAEELCINKKRSTNIYPVVASSKVMLHATKWNSLIGILRHGLLPKNDPRMVKYRYEGHGNPNTEGWLRFAGQRKAAEAHLSPGASGLIVPISYDGLILQSCMGLDPSNLMHLFSMLPSSIGSIRMDEDGESYVFRKDISLRVSFWHLPLFLWRGVWRTFQILKRLP